MVGFFIQKAFLVFCFVSCASSCSCGPGQPMTIQDQYCDATYVIKATIIERINLNTSQQSFDDKLRYSITTLDMYKTCPDYDSVHDKSTLNSAAHESLCGVDMDEGITYIISGTITEGQLWVGLCSSPILLPLEYIDPDELIYLEAQRGTCRYCNYVSISTTFPTTSPVPVSKRTTLFPFHDDSTPVQTDHVPSSSSVPVSKRTTFLPIHDDSTPVQTDNVPSSSVSSCPCGGYSQMTIQDMYCSETYIIKARINGTERMSLYPSEPYRDELRYSITTLDMYKTCGDYDSVHNKSTLHTAASESLCGVNLDEGITYILSGYIIGGKLWVGLCSLLLVPVEDIDPDKLIYLEAERGTCRYCNGQARGVYPAWILVVFLLSIAIC